jgi:hypothetical protein
VRSAGTGRGCGRRAGREYVARALERRGAASPPCCCARVVHSVRGAWGSWRKEGRVWGSGGRRWRCARVWVRMQERRGGWRMTAARGRDAGVLTIHAVPFKSPRARCHCRCQEQEAHSTTLECNAALCTPHAQRLFWRAPHACYRRRARVHGHKRAAASQTNKLTKTSKQQKRHRRSSVNICIIVSSRVCVVVRAGAAAARVERTPRSALFTAWPRAAAKPARRRHPAACHRLRKCCAC